MIPSPKLPNDTQRNVPETRKRVARMPSFEGENLQKHGHLIKWRIL